jgi:hypothetical protein
MHKSNSKINVICLSNQDFNNSLDEIKEFLKFNLDFSKNYEIPDNINIYDVALIQDRFLQKNQKIKTLENINLAKILLTDGKSKINLNYDDIIYLPSNINFFNKSVLDLCSKKQFSINSSLNIKNYILDKNEKKFRQNNRHIILTEKEIQLIELLFNKKEAVTKKTILSLVWKYSEDADTHTVETHIYRLRKKIIKEFGDENFISNSKDGYLI